MSHSSQVYSEIEVSSEALTASRHRLVQMLLEKCLQQIESAKKAILNNDIQKRHHTISKSTEIISYLRICLNFQDKQAKEMVQLLDSLYEFLEKNLLYATLKSDVVYLDQAREVLQNIKTGWDGVLPEAQ